MGAYTSRAAAAADAFIALNRVSGYGTDMRRQLEEWRDQGEMTVVLPDDSNESGIIAGWDNPDHYDYEKVYVQQLDLNPKLSVTSTLPAGCASPGRAAEDDDGGLDRRFNF